MAQSTNQKKAEGNLILFLLGVLLFSLFEDSGASGGISPASFGPSDTDNSPDKTFATPVAFINAYKDLAAYLKQYYLIPPEVTMAQAALESSYGNSYLAKHDNNFFGIVADSSWKGPTSIPNADGVRFRSYSTPKESFIDYGKFLTTNSNYDNAFTTNNPLDFAQALADGGYNGKKPEDIAAYAKSLKTAVSSLMGN